MSYRKITDLPDGVQSHLPKHAQEIYRASFNSALDEYDNAETSHKVAWSAVKKAGYSKQGDRWVKAG